MAKRLTDCGKWDDPWFYELSNEYRLLWIYILDKCDHAGIWKVNKPLAEFMLRSKPSWDDFIKTCGDRLVILSADKWFIPKFISFQYGVLSPDCRPHKPVIETLEKMNLKGYLKGIERDKEQYIYQEKDKEQEKGGVGGIEKGFNQLEDFNEFWELYPAKGRLNRSVSLRVWCEIVVRREESLRIRTALANYCAHLKANSDWGKQPKALSKWLEEWPDWEHHVEVEKEETLADHDERVLKKLRSK